MGSRLDKKSKQVRKQIENHTFDDEDGAEYGRSSFGGFGDYFRNKQLKLQNRDADIRAQSTANKPIFSGVVAHVNGYTQPSLRDLHQMIVSHGGGYLQYLSGKTNATHIIASNLTPSKRKEFEKYRVVKPAWVVDSIEAGKLLPWSDYKLIEDSRQRSLPFGGGSKVEASENPYRQQSDASWYSTKDKAATNRSGDKTADTFGGDDASDEFDFPEDGFSTLEQLSMQRQSATSPKAGLDPPVNALDVDHTKPIEPSLSTPKKRTLDVEPDGASKKPKLSAEEHNEALLADPHIRKSTVANPGFLEQFYRESRLHHLSTWKAELKSEMQALADSKSASQTLKIKRPPGARRYILHVDFDCFFAAVSLEKQPQYADQPVAVAHGTGSGSEIASCNYLARSSGVKNGMWMKRAHELCPSLKVLPYDFPGYEEASRAFYEELLALTGNATVQSVSIDEALVDITVPVLTTTDSDGINRNEGAVEREQDQANEIATKIRNSIKARTGCDVSVGIGGNILLAKVALRKAKPAGQYHILPDDVLDFIAPLEIRDLPGFAYKTGGKLEALDIKFVRDVREATKETLTNALGPKTGIKLWEYARGIDRKEVGDTEVRRSVSAEINWGIRFTNSEQVDTFMESLCTELSNRLLKEGVKGHHLTLKVMKRAADAPMDTPKFLGHGSCDTYTKSASLRVATNAVPILARESISMLKGLGISPGELRGLGVQMTKLERVKDGIGAEQNSQKLLQFKPDRFRSRPTEIPDDPIVDNITTPTKPKDVPGRVRFGAEQLNQLTPSRKPLDTMGTQFILPTQVDPSVLDELPSDIKSRLVGPGSKKRPVTKRGKSGGDGWQPFTALPSATQLDPEVLKALPEDVQREIMEFYEVPAIDERSNADSEARDWSPSPSKKPKLKKDPTPKKRGRGRPPKNSVRPAGTTTLTQANFITSHFTRKPPEDRVSSDSEPHTLPKPVAPPPADPPALDTSADAELDASYLAALPSPLRREVLLHHRLATVRAKNAALAAQRRAADALPRAAPEKRMLRLPPRAPRPRFTRAGLARMKDLRGALAAWVREFCEEGPYREDVGALAGYLVRVVGEEGVDKAVKCVRWLEWVVGEEVGEGGAVGEWARAVDAVGVEVQEAVKKKGLGRVRL